MATVNDTEFSDIYIIPDGTAFIWGGKTPSGLITVRPDDFDEFYQALIDTYARAGITSDPLTHQSTPPTIASTNSYPLSGFGSNLIHTCPYCPRPPDCLMYLPSHSPT